MKRHRLIPAALSATLVALLFSMSGCSSYKTDFYFNGEKYSHVKKMSGGEITNHFYTAGGEDMNSAENFIQILEFSDKISQSDWSKNLQPLLKRYGLSPAGDREFEMTGRMEQSGFFFKTYGAPVVVKGKDCMAFFVTLTDREGYKEARHAGDNSADISIIEELKAIELG